jgi:LAO/AO transport system kinase
MNELLQAALSGQRRAIARLMTLLEDDAPGARELLASLYAHTGRAHLIGVTGAPGSGKSTLVAQMAREYRRRGLTVGIVAVDPSSPFSGGALLGDRIRMGALSGDGGIFLRSMASRGALGGLARATDNVVSVLDACGFQRILIETVGAGQTEIDIARTAHTTLVIQVPGMGDDIQALKAGILEIADILVLNKADHEGAEQTLAILRAMLALRAAPEGWPLPLIRTVATTGEGLPQLIDAIEGHVAYLCQGGHLEAHERRRAAWELDALLREELLRRLRAQVGEGRYEEMVERLAARQLDPYAAANELLRARPLP